MNLDDERICINVEGFSVEKKKLVQDAFFKLGYCWDNGKKYKYLGDLGAKMYTNTYEVGGNFCRALLWGSDINEKEKQYEHTFNELMERAGMNEHKEEIKLDDKVTLEMSVGEFLAASTCLGRSSNYTSFCYYGIFLDKAEALGLGELLNDLCSYNYSYVRASVGLSTEDMIQDYFKPKETETQKKARLLREEAEKMLQQAKELEDSL